MSRKSKKDLLRELRKSYANGSTISQESKLELINILQEELIEEGFTIRKDGEPELINDFVYFENSLGVGL